MEAVILAGGKAERLGEAARGRPKALVELAGRPLAAHQVALLVGAGVERVLVSCAAGQEDLFESELAGLGAEVVAVPEREPLGRGGGIRLAASARQEMGDLYALNGDELIDADLVALLQRHLERGWAATIVVTRPRSPFGVVDLGDDDGIVGFEEAGRLPHWVSCGVYVLGEEALAALPERGDHESTTFPDLALNDRLGAFRHDGVWLTVNTPKELRVADEYLTAHPDWLDSRAGTGL
jgi:NDP-sugar pyrophosphorylase family protein